MIGSRPRRRSPRWPGRRRPGRARGLALGPAGAVGARSARGARPRLGRTAAARPRPCPRSRRSRVRPPIARRPHRRPVLPIGQRADRRRRPERSSTRRRPRSASWVTTPRSSARRSPRTSCCAGRSAPTRPEPSFSATPGGPASGIITEPNAHPLNAERARRRRRGPYVAAVLNGDVDNFADLHADEGLAIAADDHHRRQGHPDADGSPPRRGPRARRGVPPHRRHARGLGGHRRRRRQRIPIGCSSRCGGAARRSTSAWPRTPSSWPASPTAWWRRPTRYIRMDGETPAQPREPHRQPRPDRRARRRRGRIARRASSARPTTAPTCRSPRTMSPSPRSPPATSTAATTPTTC